MPSLSTQLLRESVTGDARAIERLFDVVYDDLRRRAQGFFRRESAANTLQPTALVHEAFLKMVDQREANWRDRSHFFRVASMVMRRILVDRARNRTSQKRGSGLSPVTIPDSAAQISPNRIDDVLLVDQLLNRLAGEDPRQVAIIEMRFFGGMTVEEVALELDMPKRTVEAEWTVIRAELRKEMLGK